MSWQQFIMGSLDVSSSSFLLDASFFPFLWLSFSTSKCFYMIWINIITLSAVKWNLFFKTVATEAVDTFVHISFIWHYCICLWFNFYVIFQVRFNPFLDYCVLVQDFFFCLWVALAEDFSPVWEKPKASVRSNIQPVCFSQEPDASEVRQKILTAVDTMIFLVNYERVLQDV